MKQLKEKMKNFLILFNFMFFSEQDKSEKAVSLSGIIELLLLFFLLFLPWQTRWLAGPAFTNGIYNEYVTISFYGTEILLWLIVFLFFWSLYQKKKISAQIFSRDYLLKNSKRAILAGTVLLVLLLIVRLFEPASVQFSGRLLLSILIAVVIYNSRLSFSSLSASLWLSGVGQGIFGFYQFLNQKILANKWLGIANQDPYISGSSVVQTGTERWLRAYGSFGSPNSLGIYLAAIFVLGLILYYHFVPKKYRTLFLSGQVLILLGLISSFSRGAWIAAMVGLILFVFIEFSHWSGDTYRFFLKFLKSALVYGLVILVFILSSSHLFGARFKAEGELENMSISERQAQMTESRDLFFSHPWRGVGLGIYTISLAKAIPLPSYGFYQPAHNIYILILTEGGILGMILIFGFYLSVVWKIFQDNFIYVPVVAVLFVAGLFDHWLWTMFTGLIFWWVIMGIGLKKIKD